MDSVLVVAAQVVILNQQFCTYQYDCDFHSPIHVQFRLGCNEIGGQGAELLCEALLQNTSKSVKSIV